MDIAVILFVTGAMTVCIGAMYFALQNNNNPSLCFYTSPGVAQIILSVIIVSFLIHWAVGVSVVILLIYLFFCAMKFLNFL